MGITQILDNAASSMRSTQEQINVTGENIAGVDNKYYIRKEAKVNPLIANGKGSGTQVNISSATVDQFIIRGLQEKTSDFKTSDIWNSYYDKIAMTLGNPKNNINDPKTFTSINSLLNGFFTSVSNLSQSPNISTSKQDFLNKTDQLVNRIKDISRTLQELRLNADKEIKNSVDDFNMLIDKLNNANIESANAQVTKSDTSSFDMIKYETVTKLSELIDIKSINRDMGQINLYTTAGISLLDSNRYHLKYEPISSVSALIENKQVSALEYYSVSSQNIETYQGKLITNGLSSSVVTSLKGGKIFALQQMRDVEIPKVLSILDNLADQITFQLNAAHNSGASSNAPISLTGQTLTNSFDQRNYSGKFRVAVVDKNGNSVNYDPEMINGSLVSRPIKPLDIDLSSLNSGDGAGLVTMQTIIDEINQYYFFNPTDSRVKMGGIEDIKLVSKQNNLLSGGTFDFDFEFDNQDDQDYNYEIMDISVNNLAGGVTSELPSKGIISNFTRNRSGNTNQISLAGGVGGDYTITARIKVSDKNANTYVSDIKFVINDNQSGILNKRFTPVSATGDNTILGTRGATYIASSTTQRIAKASIVDAEGQEVAAGENGYLNITSLNGEKFRIVIDDKIVDANGNMSKPSIELGNNSIKATNKGFGHFMGLNNLLVDNLKVDGSAINMKVNPNVVNDLNNLATGKLKLTNKSSDTLQTFGINNAKASLQFFSIPSAGDTLSINNQVFTFVNGPASIGQIDISSGSMSTVLQNLVNSLSAENSISNANAVNLLSFSQSNTSLDTLIITSKAKGKIGNSFEISGNFKSAVSLNNSDLTTVPSGTLVGGIDDTNLVEKTLPRFSIGKKSNDTVLAIVGLQDTSIKFNAAGSISSVNQTLGQYTTLFTSFISKNASIADQNFKQQENLINIYSDRFKESTGVNIQVELGNLVKFQSIYIAQTKIVNTSNDLFKQLMNLI